MAVDLSQSTPEDTLVQIVFSATDAESDPLTFAVGLTPSHGQVSNFGSPDCSLPPTCTETLDYTPDQDYFGSDSFTYTANDGSSPSNVATVSITVTPVNDPPVATDQNPSGNEDTVQHVTLSATDVDGDALSFAIGAAPAHGLVGTIGAPFCVGSPTSTCTANVDYTPSTNYHGPDSFTYTANDSTVPSNTATVSITVTSVNDPPVGAALAPSTTEDTAKGITLSATDVDGDGLSFALGATHVAHGTLGTFGVAGCSGSPSTCTSAVTYMPNANFNGTDSFSYTASDGTASSSPALVTITVGAANDAPVCPAASKTGAEETLLGGTLVCTDVDSASLTYAKVAGPAHGTATVNGNGTWSYQPNANYNGPDSFTYKANDTILDSVPATVSLTVSPVNDPPNAANDVGLTVTQNATAASLPVLANDSDLPDSGETLSITAVTQGGHGTVRFTAAGLTYAPAPTYRGTDSFTYTISDGTLTDTATVLLTVVKAGAVTRLAGPDRYATSAAISKATFGPSVPVAYIASGLGFADALSGAPVAGMVGGPILLVTPMVIPASIKAELTRLKPARIIILGGTGVVSTAVAASLQAYTTGLVSRLAGPDRYATSATISRSNFSPGGPIAYIASGLGFADALSGAPVAAIRRGPILLVTPTAIPATIKAELTRLKPARIIILGGTGVVSATVATQLKAYSPSVGRQSGPDRYATSATISKNSFTARVPVAYIASGLGFADALSGAPVAGIKGGPILLITPTAIPASIAAELIRLKPANIVILGGTGVVSAAVAALLAFYTTGP